jgi:hypothetical protein
VLAFTFESTLGGQDLLGEVLWSVKLRVGKSFRRNASIISQVVSALATKFLGLWILMLTFWAFHFLCPHFHGKDTKKRKELIQDWSKIIYNT